MKKFMISILVLSALNLFAQNKEDKDTMQYKYPLEIVINGSRLSMPLKFNTFSTDLVEQDVLSTLTKGINLGEPMKLVPGVRVEDQANGTRVHFSIRGQGILSERGIRGTRFLLDGIPLNDPSGFAPDIYDIDWFNVDNIEVLKGTGGSLYGGSGSAGIVSIKTFDGPGKPFGVNAEGLYGSYNFWKGMLQFGSNVKNVNYRFSASRMMGDGYREHTHFWGNNLYLKFNYTPSKSLILTPIFMYTESFNENPEGINLEQYNTDPTQPNPDAIPYNEFLETKRFTGGVTGQAVVNKINLFDFNIYGKRTSFTEANNRTFVDRTYDIPGGTFQYTLLTGKKKTKNYSSIGTDIQFQSVVESRTGNLYSVRRNEKLSDQSINQQSYGIFLIDRLELNDEYNFTGSIRYDYINNKLDDNLKVNGTDLSGSKSFDHVSWKLGMSYSPYEYFNLYCNYGTGFLPPAVEELAQNPVKFGGFNETLVPSTSQGPELGFRGIISEKIYYDITGFYLLTKDDFNRYRITDSLRSQETFYNNAGNSNRFGIELYAKYIPLNNLTIQAAYTYSDFKYSLDQPFRIVMDDTSIVKYAVDGNYLPNIPKHQFNLDIMYYPLPELLLKFNPEYSSISYIDGANLESEAANSYLLLNFRAAYNLRIGGTSCQINFTAKNITDKKYLGFTEPDPGGNAYQPAAGSEFFAGLKITF
ncbi:MAG: TonB-dependent receptor [Bacteroidetes bacterium]|nr:TonB-dependent receptor [Bacteroidota bacterium]